MNNTNLQHQHHLHLTKGLSVVPSERPRKRTQNTASGIHDMHDKTSQITGNSGCLFNGLFLQTEMNT